MCAQWKNLRSHYGYFTYNGQWYIYPTKQCSPCLRWSLFEIKRAYLYMHSITHPRTHSLIHSTHPHIYSRTISPTHTLTHPFHTSIIVCMCAFAYFVTIIICVLCIIYHWIFNAWAQNMPNQLITCFPTISVIYGSVDDLCVFLHTAGTITSWCTADLWVALHTAGTIISW